MPQNSFKIVRLGRWLLDKLDNSTLKEGFLGDIEEEFYLHVENKGKWSAYLWYLIYIFKMLPSLTLQSIHRSTSMFLNYFKITARTLIKYKGFSIINVLGLATSMSIAIIIILFIADQSSYDTFQKNRDHIYLVTTDFKHHSTMIPDNTYATSPAPISATLKDAFPQIKKTVQLRRWAGINTFYGETMIDVYGLFAEETFFDVFSYALVQGDPQTALKQPFSIIISEDVAEMLFQEEEPLGKTLVVNTSHAYTVTGVLKKNSYRSHLRFEALVSFSTLRSLEVQQDGVKSLDDWTHVSSYYNYLFVEHGETVQPIKNALPSIVAETYDKDIAGNYAFNIVRLSDINMGPELSNMPGPSASSALIYAFTVLGFLITLTACFNYLNLSIARSIKRSKEIGLRKVMGAKRKQIVIQFLLEATSIAFIALLVSVVLLTWLLPMFNNLQFMQEERIRISLDFINNIDVYLLFLGLTLIVGLMAGMYPAAYLSRFLPSKVLKGNTISKKSSFKLRKTLMVVQLTLSLLFITFATMNHKAFELEFNADYGFDANNLLTVQLRDINFETFKNAITQHPGITAVSATSSMPVTGSMNIRKFSNAGAGQQTSAFSYFIDESFIDNLRLTIVQGRNFSKDRTTDTQRSIIINETAAKSFGFVQPEEAIGQMLFASNDKKYTIIGVVKDFHLRRIRQPIRPTVLMLDPAMFSIALIRFAPENGKSITSFLEEQWKTQSPYRAMQYDIYRSELEDKLSDLRDIKNVATAAALVAISIACLGLLGMVTYNVEAKTKEIGIRKVIGAKVNNVILLLSREFIILIGIAVMLATPPITFITNLTVREFGMSPFIGISSFFLSLVIIITLAMTTICSQTVRAALANPVTTLRNE